MGWTRGGDLEFYLAQRVIADQISQLGFQINHQALSLGPIVDKLVNRNYQFYNSAFFGEIPDLEPNFRLGAFHTKGIPDGSNYSQYRNPTEYDPAYDEFKQTVKAEPRKQAAQKCSRILNRDQPYLFTHAADILAVANTNHFTGWKPGNYDWPFFNFENFNSLEPVNGQENLVLAETREPTQVNYMSLTDGLPNKQLNMMYHDHLVTVDASGEPLPWAAKDWTIQSPTTIDFTLREGMKFHDGEEVTAEDVAFTFNFLKQYKVPYVINFYQSIDNAEALEDYKVRINFSQADGAFIAAGTAQLPILPKHVWEGVVERENLGHPREWQSEQAYISSGPFQLTEVQSGSHLTLEVFDDHHSADFNFKQLIWNIYGSKATAVGALESDEASMMMSPGVSNFERLSNVSQLQAFNLESFTAGLVLPAAGAGDNWKMNPKCLIDPAFHLALAWAIDRDEVVNTVLRGRGYKIFSILPKKHPYHASDLPVKPNNDMERARQILTDAGYRWNDNGQLMYPERRIQKIEEQQLGGSFKPPEWLPESALG